MRKKTGNKLHTWEAALLLAVAAALLWGACTLQRQDALEQKVIRLHVIANSDSEADQALKLRVRDRVLVLTEDILRQSGDMEEARQRLAEALPRLQQTAAEEIAAQGSRYTVSARLEETEFPTREYDGFALPSGEYLALRVVIGEGAGKNWWCVVFPSLCLPAASGEEALLSLPEEQRRLVEDSQQCQVKLKAVELWEALREWLRG